MTLGPLILSSCGKIPESSEAAEAPSEILDLPPLDSAKTEKAWPPSQSPNTVLHWTFDHPHDFGAFEHDASGMSHDGVVIWDRIGAGGGFRWKPNKGLLGGAGHLAKGIRGTLSTERELSLPEEWTLSLMVKPLVKKNRYAEFIVFHSSRKDEKTGKMTPKPHFSLAQNGRFNIQAHMGEAKGEAQFLGKELMTPDQWNHLVVVYKKDTITMIVNGKADTRPNPVKWSSDQKFKILLSGHNGAPHHRLEGDYDEFRIYPRALSESEIEKLGEADFYKTEKRLPIADAGMGYTAWLKGGKAEFNMSGSEKGKDNLLSNTPFPLKMSIAIR